MLQTAVLSLLIISLAACSSGSSEITPDQASTNTVPGKKADDATDGAEGSNDGGESAEKDAGSGDNKTDNGTENQESNTGNESQEDGNNNAGSDDPANPAAAITTDSDAGRLIERINYLSQRTVLGLSQALSQGELLTDQQQNCLGSFEPANGNQLLSVKCDVPLATGDVPLYSALAVLADTPQCRDSLLSGAEDGCYALQADITVSTLWRVPESGRPIPEPGGYLRYNVADSGRLILENLPERFAGNFYCELDLSTGEWINTERPGNCNLDIAVLYDLINDHLSM